jgi:hypothetical protein
MHPNETSTCLRFSIGLETVSLSRGYAVSVKADKSQEGRVDAENVGNLEIQAAYIIQS